MKNKAIMGKLKLLLSAFVIALATVISAFAQSGTSSISGVVTDQTGAAVPGATVTISNTATGFTRNTTTSNDGSYSFPGIPPATYKLEVEAGNFKKAVNNNVQALVDTKATADIALEPGDVTAVVDVTTNTIESVVNTQDASLGNTFVPEQITQLPTNLRQVNDLLSLQPAVTREGYVAGGRSDQANITLDGVDVNDQQTGGRSNQFQTTQGSVLRSTTESVSEFRITTTNANANQGRSSGAQISLVTRSGTNKFHGAGFYFYRPTAFSANEFFNNAAGSYTATDQAVIDGNAAVGEQRAPRPSLARDVFGGRLGGPIVKDKLFFFYNYEGQRQTLGTPVVRVVPLAHMGQGELRFNGTGPSCDAAGNCRIGLAELNTIYAQAGINPDVVALFANVNSKYASNDSSVGDGINTGGFRFNAPTTISQNTHIARFDYNISDRHQLFVRGNYQHDLTAGSTDPAFAQQFPDTSPTTLWSHPLGFVVGHNWTVSDNKINNFRYGLTRQAFTQGGDSSNNSIVFRFVFSPTLNPSVRELSRITDTHNFTDDFTWISGNHTWQFGGNMRIIRNRRSSLSGAFDSASTNPSFYELSGAVVDARIRAAGYTIDEGSIASVQAAATALIGRYSQYSGNFTFDLDGNVLPAGTASDRLFATEEYEGYVQDTWRPLRNLTLTLGLRYGISRPVYEKNGFQVVPDIALSDLLDKRIATSQFGVPTNDLVNFVRGGPVNNGPGFYPMDKNNWQPRFAAAWSPNFESGFLHSLFGDEGDSTIRGGFAVTNSAFGQQLAVSFDALSTIGFTSSTTISANTYNVTDNLGPRFSGFGQDIRSLPGIPVPTQLFSTPADESQRIQSSLDRNIVSPKTYSWNVSYGRSLPKGMYFEASYIGSVSRNLFSSQDVVTFNNLVDPASGVDWYTAMGQLVDARAADTDINSLAAIPYFENLFPDFGANFWGFPAWNSTQAVFALIARTDFTNGTGICAPDPACGFFDVADYTYIQTLLDDAGVYPNMFVHPQYAAFASYGTTARSNYHGGSFSLRQRLGDVLSYDVNYTFSKSMDTGSGLQGADNATTGYGTAFILNPLRPEDNYSVSDFDSRHIVNANFIFQLPFGKGRKMFSGVNSFADAVIGGWQLAGVYRWNTGLPIFSPFDQAQWATNWNAQSSGVRVRDLRSSVDRNTQNIFSDPQAAFNSFRNARPGETGDRNFLRLPGYSTLDLGLSKNFMMPWSENHKLQLRWEVFNVTNVQYFGLDAPQTGITRSTWGLPQDSDTGTAAGNFGNIFTTIQGAPRSMQFGLRYEF
ncbi:MAG: TonB-dependent receptor [Pyrinomonadaceae bacterium]